MEKVKSIFESKLAQIYLSSLIKHNDWHKQVLIWMIINQDKYDTLETPESRFQQYVNLFAIVIINHYNKLVKNIDNLTFTPMWVLEKKNLDFTTAFFSLHTSTIWDINELSAEWLAATNQKEKIQQLFDISEDLYKLTSEYKTLNLLQYHIEGSQKLKKLYPFVSIQTEIMEQGFNYYQFEDVEEEMHQQWQQWSELILSSFKNMIKVCVKEFNLFIKSFDDTTLLQIKNIQYNNKLVKFVNNIK